MKNLTPKQKRLYLFLKKKKNWRPPSWGQMKNFLKVSSNQTIADYLKAIKRKGYKI